jgi:hypothetical protein
MRERIRANHNHPKLTLGYGATALGYEKQPQPGQNQTDPLKLTTFWQRVQGVVWNNSLGM